MKPYYESPLSSRYASEEMLRLFSPDTRYRTWRRLWVALARAEHELGLPVTCEQVKELEAHAGDEIDYEAVAKKEKQLRQKSKLLFLVRMFITQVVLRQYIFYLSYSNIFPQIRRNT